MLRSESGHEFKLFSREQTRYLILSDLVGLPIKSLVFGGKLLEIMSCILISEKTAFSSASDCLTLFDQKNKKMGLSKHKLISVLKYFPIFSILCLSHWDVIWTYNFRFGWCIKWYWKMSGSENLNAKSSWYNLEGI